MATQGSSKSSALSRRPLILKSAALAALTVFRPVMATAQSDAAPGLAPDAVRPFRAHVPQATLVDLRRRLAATRWPDRETVTDRSQGVQLASSPNMAGISIPAAVTIFPGEVYKPPKSWAARAYRNLVYYQRVDKGEHFAAWEEPDLFSAEVRAAFRSMR